MNVKKLAARLALIPGAAVVASRSARLALIPAAVVASLSTAHAALPEEVETAVTAAKADIGEAGALGIGVFLAIMLFVWLRRVMR